MHTRKCVNVQCRVETFKADHMIPLSGCPVCLMPGVVAAEHQLRTLEKKSG